MGAAGAIFLCAAFSALYVASLYVWSCPHGRDHPSTIKKRFASAFAMSLLSPAFLWWNLDEDGGEWSLAERMGLRLSGLLVAAALPLLLTAVLFLGPLAMLCFSGIWKVGAEPTYWWNSFSDLTWIRNYVVAPISEEFTYRSCMMPLLLQHMSPGRAVIICPLFFGIAHFHHAIEKLKNGGDLSTTLKVSTFQFLYTTLFGAYSAFLFARTGHLVAPVAAHIFCNHMGFPNFGAVPLYPKAQSLVISLCFVLGLTLWCFLLYPLTEPTYYHNEIHWKECISE